MIALTLVQYSIMLSRDCPRDWMGLENIIITIKYIFIPKTQLQYFILVAKSVYKYKESQHKLSDIESEAEEGSHIM